MGENGSHGFYVFDKAFALIGEDQPLGAVAFREGRIDESEGDELVDPLKLGLLVSLLQSHDVGLRAIGVLLDRNENVHCMFAFEHFEIFVFYHALGIGVGIICSMCLFRILQLDTASKGIFGDRISLGEVEQSADLRIIG